MDVSFRSIVESASEQLGLNYSIGDEWNSTAVEFDPHCIGAVREATSMLDYPTMEMASGAGHDSVYVSSVAATSMTFIPCKDGLSHNEAESATKDHLEAGCNLLMHAMLDRARSANQGS